MWVYRHGKISHAFVVFITPVMYYNGIMSTGGACFLPERNAGITEQPKRKEVKRGDKQSDGRIVPEIALNREGGKPKENQSSWFLPCRTISKEKHYLYTEVGKNNGNETCENNTTFNRKPEHGIYISGTLHQRGDA